MDKPDRRLVSIKGEIDKPAERQYGQLPKLESQLNAADTAAAKVGADGTAKNRRRGMQVGTGEIAEVVWRATGIPSAR